MDEKTGKALLKLVKLSGATEATVCENSEPKFKNCSDENRNHIWNDGHYIWRCKNCEVTYAEGCAPWEDTGDFYEDDYEPLICPDCLRTEDWCECE